MTQRERNLALVAAAMLGVMAVVGLVWFYKLWSSLDDDIQIARDQVQEAEAKIFKAKADAPKLEHWRRLSLPADIRTARGEYQQFLINLMHKTGVTLDQFPPSPNDVKSQAVLLSKNKQPIYTALNFNPRIKARMTNLVRFLEEFQKAPKMHRIKSMVIERTDNSAKKDPEGMTVTLGIEALIILDADKDANQFLSKRGIKGIEGLQILNTDKDLKKAAVGDKLRQKFIEADLIMSLRHGPIGLFTASWRLGPTGDVLPPLNPPLAYRNYTDIARRNILIGPAIDPYALPPQAPTDEMVNRMRYNRFIGVVGADGKIEAKFWDASTNEYTRARAVGGFNKIALVQTGLVEIGDEYVQLVLINGIVQKVEDRQILLRVTVNAGDPIETQWWRYPNDTNYYKLHKDDLAPIVKKGKLRAEDKDHLYVVARRYWSDLVRERKILLTGKYYSAQTDGSRGEVAFEDSSVVIIRPESWPPQAAFEAAGVAANRLYPDPYRIYGIQDNHFDLLVASNKAKKEDIDDMYVMSPEYWDVLRDDQLIKQESGSTYVIYKNLVKIEVVDHTPDLVVFRVPKKYCQFPGIAKTDDHPGTPPRWHEGFCVLKMDRMVQDSLLEPLSEADVNKLLRPAAPASGTGGN